MGWEYLKNKHISRELIAAFPDADADLCRRLELARAMSVLVPPIYTRSQGLQGTGWCAFWLFCMAAGAPCADSSGMVDDDAPHAVGLRIVSSLRRRQSSLAICTAAW